MQYTRRRVNNFVDVPAALHDGDALRIRHDRRTLVTYDIDVGDQSDNQSISTRTRLTEELDIAAMESHTKSA